MGPKKRGAKKAAAGAGDPQGQDGGSTTAAAIKRKAEETTANGSKAGAKKGCPKVDPECPKATTCQIHISPEDGKPLACVLNQTNLFQNNNKFFILQVIKEKDVDVFYTWIRWGRVGYKGQTNLIACGGDEDKAIQAMEKKFQDKTKNKWSERDDFQPVDGKYKLVEMDADEDEEEEVKKEDDCDGPTSKKTVKVEKEEVVESKLESALQELIKMICDIKAMELEASELEFDTKRNPLGKVSAAQIKAGYESLATIAKLLEEGAQPNSSALKELSGEFYTRIPHFFGMSTPPAIRTMDKVREKIKLLEVLSDVKLGLDLMKQRRAEEKINPIDRYYNNLNCDLKTLAADSEDFSLVEQYIMSTHAKTHNQYTMDVVDVFMCTKNTPFNEKLSNRKLLFHGSRMSNWCGILSQGLRIAPPEAPVTGYMFGKGVYFADMSSKSANYCYASPKNPWGLLLLCEVALGKENELMAADYKADKLPKGKNSVKGCGEMGPDPKNAVKMEDGRTVVPMGPGVKTRDRQSLIYNEYIVYNTNQIRLRYIAKIKFNFK